MDVVTVLEQALLTGAAQAVQGQAGAATAGAITKLRTVLGRVFGNDPVASTAVDKVAAGQDAAVWREQLRARLETLPASDLQELVAQAQAVLGLTDPGGSVAGRYAVDLRDAKGVQVNY